MATTCPQCNTPIVPGAMFCDNCGANLASAPAPQPATVVSPPPPGLAPVGGSTCPQCGQANIAGSMFCEHCGAAMGQQPTPGGYPPPPPPVHGPVMPPPPVAPVAGVVAGRFVLTASGTTLPIPPGKSEVIIGREDPASSNFPEVDLESHDGLNNGVGRQHVKITAQGGQVYVEDLKTVNGTFLRGQKLQPGARQPLNNGDELILGKLKLQYFSS